MILLFGKNIGQLGVVPKSESVVLPQSRVLSNFAKTQVRLSRTRSKLAVQITPIHAAKWGWRDNCALGLPLDSWRDDVAPGGGISLQLASW